MRNQRKCNKVISYIYHLLAPSKGCRISFPAPLATQPGVGTMLSSAITDFEKLHKKALESPSRNSRIIRSFANQTPHANPKINYFVSRSCQFVRFCYTHGNTIYMYTSDGSNEAARIRDDGKNNYTF